MSKPPSVYDMGKKEHEAILVLMKYFEPYGGVLHMKKHSILIKAGHMDKEFVGLR